MADRPAAGGKPLDSTPTTTASQISATTSPGPTSRASNRGGGRLRGAGAEVAGGPDPALTFGTSGVTLAADPHHHRRRDRHDPDRRGPCHGAPLAGRAGARDRPPARRRPGVFGEASAPRAGASRRPGTSRRWPTLPLTRRLRRGLQLRRRDARRPGDENPWLVTRSAARRPARRARCRCSASASAPRSSPRPPASPPAAPPSRDRLVRGRGQRGGPNDPVLGPLAPSFEAFGWHSYECYLPAGAVPLARSETCLQAFRMGDRA